MRRTIGLVGVCVFVAGAIALVGCGAKTATEGDATTANINGAPPSPAKKDAKEPQETPAAKESRPLSTQADAFHPVVVIETTHGDIRVTLDREHAPMTVDNFLSYVARGHYDGTIFHQVLKDYVIIGGGFTPDGTEKKVNTPVYTEARNGQKNVRGAMAMVRKPEQPHSATCQFFINVSDNPNLDYEGDSFDKYGYCVFGHVAPESMAVVDRIASVPVEDRPKFERIPIDAVVIKSIKRYH
ncbi:MAG: peptidylprolyl isomerase [Thermoguttaceae bacterium]|nr:peptidylprolyl isomerase [Thermoguttaceae bacterium]